MIGSKTTGNNFGGLIQYLTREDKLEWLESRNTVSDTPDVLARDMEFTAKKSARIKEAVYHVSISWKHGENPSRQQMINVADNFLKHMEVEQHQAAIVSHRDKAYKHLHIVINRVHPETGKGWEPYLYEGEGRERTVAQTDYGRIEEFLRATERQYGWEVTPGLHAGTWEREFDGRRPTQGEYHWGKKLAEIENQLPEDVHLATVQQRAEQLKDDLYYAESFDEFDQRLATKGLWIESKGQGAIITDGNYSIKASSVSRGFSGGRLEERFDENLKEYEANREQYVDIEAAGQQVADWASLKERVIIENAEDFTRWQIESYATELYSLDEYDEALSSVKEKIKDSFQQTYHKPAEAYDLFGKYSGAQSYEEAKEIIGSTPERFGDVKDRAGAVGISKAIRAFDKLQGQYSTMITQATQEQRNEKKQVLQAGADKWKSVERNIAGVVEAQARRGLQETEGGQTIDSSAANVIAIARLSKQIAENPKFAPQAGTQEVAGRLAAAMDSEGGRVVGSMMMKTIKQSQAALQMIRNPTSAPIKIVNSVIQAAVRQGQSAGRDRGLSL